MTDDPVIEEYKICAAMIRHLDEQNWNWGAFLFGGSLAATGFVLSQRATFARLAALSVISTIVLVGWLAYITRAASIRDIYLERMRTIEAYNYQLQIQIQTVIQSRLHKIFPLRLLWILTIMIALYLGTLYLGALILLLHVPILE